MNLYDFKGKAALVTGAAQGLGAEIAVTLGRHGASLIIVDKNRAESTQNRLEDLGVPCLAAQVDVSHEEQVRGLVKQAVGKFGRIHILVNNAGLSQLSHTPTQDLPVEEWDQVIGVNLRGTFLCCKHLGASMIESGGGSIINIASTAGITGVPRAPAYCASKAGVILLTKSLALEWALHHIRINAIAPHYLETDLTWELRENEKVFKALSGQIPLNRFGKTSEITGVVLFLASDASTYMTGSIIPVDGGYLAR